ncbi:MAG: glycine--tRNA ligase, partial [Candidatus Kerfeldbacteria bacterium]|nr:glycine--tRNA ligase [Candidatus Kerfeldbacteria bacterium]
MSSQHETPQNAVMEKLISLSKQRGFLFPTAEIYGGLGGFWDWGPLGVELKNNIKRMWWKRFVQERTDVVGLDSAIVTNPAVWKASGHAEKFFDYLSECKKCHRRYKVDVLKNGEWVTSTGENLSESTCPNCGAEASMTEPKTFNTMFKTFVGPAEETASTAYLRPETAQNIFVNFENVVQSTRKKLPFGIAQIGKAFRNEITPGNFVFRSREFEQMELEYFVRPGEDEQWFETLVKESKQWFLDLGIHPDHLK